MPRIRDLGINVIPITMLPAGGGAGGYRMTGCEGKTGRPAPDPCNATRPTDDCNCTASTIHCECTRSDQEDPPSDLCDCTATNRGRSHQTHDDKQQASAFDGRDLALLRGQLRDRLSQPLAY